jgi:TolB-like protein
MSNDTDQRWKSLLLIVAALAVLVGASIGAVVLSSGLGRRPTSLPAASGRSSLAVLNFENRTGQPRYDRYAADAAELLIAGLARPDATLNLVGAERLLDELQAMKRSFDSLDHAAALQLARRCGARYMLRGELLAASRDIILKSEVTEVNSGRLASSRQVAGLNDQNLLEKIDELSRLVREDLSEIGRR